jgi:3-hydroxyisobutyrate dehydrogenase-like beta-hydroxyacid dehydrogenase
MSDNNKQHVTVIGLGKMGTALATALVAAGHQTTVWNRTPEKADPLVAKGALRAGTVADAIAASPVAILSVFDYDSVGELLAPNAANLSGRALVNLTNSTPDEARAMAVWAAENGADYLDGAMMAVPETVATPHAFFLYSGSKKVFDAHRRALDTLAASHYLNEDAGVAEFYDLGLLSAGYAALTGFLHAVALLDTANVTPTEFIPLVTQWLHDMVAFMPELAQEIESGDYTNAASPVGMNRVVVDNLIRISRALGVDARVHSPLQALLHRQVADGHGADSFSSLFQLLKKQE